MVSYIKNNINADVSVGLIEGESHFFKFGEGEIGTISNPSTVWIGSEEFSGYLSYPVEAVNMDLYSSSVSDTTQRVVFSGLDKYWKQQTEVIDINGVTPVTTQYKYLRVTRITVVGGGTLVGKLYVSETNTVTPVYAMIGNGLASRNRTQQCAFAVPAGHVIFIDSVEVSAYGGKKSNMYAVDRDWKQAEEYNTTNPPWRVVLNWNLKDQVTQTRFKHPFAVTECQDIEIRGYTETGVDYVAASMFGSIKQLNSVPIDITELVAVLGSGQVELQWTALTPSENQDQAYFEVTYADHKQSHKVDVARGDSSVIIGDLDSSIPHTFTVKFVGYDGLKSEGVQVITTPV